MNQQKLLKVFFGAGALVLFVLIGFAVRDVAREKGKSAVEERLKKLGLTPETFAQFTKRKEEALRQIKEKPDLVIPYVDLAAAEQSLGNTDAAIAALTRAGQVAPTNHLVFGNLANLYKEKQMYKEAEIAYKRSLQYGKGEFENYIQYADFLRYRFPDRRDDILAIYAKGIETLRGNLNILRARAVYYRDIGDLVHALEDWKTVLKNDQKNVAVQQEIQEIETKLKSAQ